MEPNLELVADHQYVGMGRGCTWMVEGKRCDRPSSEHANPGPSNGHLIYTHPHDHMGGETGYCIYAVPGEGGADRVCGYPLALHMWAERDRAHAPLPVKKADVAQYRAAPMPDAARRGPVVTLIDSPVDPLGTMAVIGGIYEGRVARNKSEVTDEQRRAMLADMQQTVLNGPLECIQFTFLVEGVTRSITHQMVRSRFAFFAQESLRFAVKEDWAAEVPLPPALLGRREDDPLVMVWRRSMNQAEDSYAALVAAGLPAEEARGVLPHDITTRLYWTVSLRTLLAEAGKRTCTQAQFPWRQIMGGVAQALRLRGAKGYQAYMVQGHRDNDGWQYLSFADLLRPVCYQEGHCGFMAKFDRGCTIRNRVDANAAIGRPASEWGTEYDVVDPSEVVVGVGPRSVVVDRDGRTPVFIGAIEDREWAADPTAARVQEE